MQRWHGLDAVPSGWGHCVVTIGVFDGVHRGHAGDHRPTPSQRPPTAGCPASLITFVPHPSEVVRPGSHPPVLTTIVRRAELVEQLGVGRVLRAAVHARVLEDAAGRVRPPRARRPPARLRPSIVGENFRFGHKAAGRRRHAGTGSAAASASPPKASRCCTEGDTTLSATYVRSCVTGRRRDHGRRRRSGRPHRVDGVVERGDQRGRDLGFPTANLRTDAWAAVPADGVYAGRVVRLDEWGRTIQAPPLGVAAISVGTNPTFEVRQRRVEAYVLDFDRRPLRRRRWASSSSSGCAAWRATTASTPWSPRCTPTSTAPAPCSPDPRFATVAVGSPPDFAGIASQLAGRRAGQSASSLRSTRPNSSWPTAPGQAGGEARQPGRRRCPRARSTATRCRAARPSVRPSRSSPCRASRSGTWPRPAVAPAAATSTISIGSSNPSRPTCVRATNTVPTPLGAGRASPGCRQRDVTGVRRPVDQPGPRLVGRTVGVVASRANSAMRPL